MSTVTGADRPCGRCGHVDDKGRPCVLSEPLHRREEMVWPHDFVPVESRSAQGAEDRCAFKFSDDPGTGACSTPRGAHGAMMHAFVPPSPPVADPVTIGLPPHLAKDSPPVAVCTSCGRKTWSKNPGALCNMPQPNGSVCRGTWYRPAPVADSPKPLPWSGEVTPTREELRSARERVNPTPRDPEAESPKPADEAAACIGCSGNYGEHKKGCPSHPDRLVVIIAASVFGAMHPYLLTGACEVARKAFAAGRREVMRMVEAERDDWLGGDNGDRTHWDVLNRLCKDIAHGEVIEAGAAWRELWESLAGLRGEISEAAEVDAEWDRVDKALNALAALLESTNG